VDVDFYIKARDRFIGLQIKPQNKGVQLPEIYKEYQIQKNTHEKFTKEFGGNVFYIFSAKNPEGKKEIVNKEIVEEIQKEIQRLNSDI
jgi:hypothetical protein